MSLNLLPQKNRVRKTILHCFAISVAVLILSSSLAFYFYKTQLKIIQAENKKLSDLKKAVLPFDANLFNKMESEYESLKQKWGMLSDDEKHNTALIKNLENIIEETPRGIVLLNLNILEREIQIDGFYQNKKDLEKFLQRLYKMLKNRNPAVELDEKQDHLEFKISFKRKIDHENSK